jgi:hypothetical protein
MHSKSNGSDAQSQMEVNILNVNDALIRTIIDQTILQFQFLHILTYGIAL